MPETNERDALQRADRKHRLPLYWLRQFFCRAFDLYLLKVQSAEASVGRLQAVALVVWATAAPLVVSIHGVMGWINTGPPVRVIKTAANESKTEQLASGSVLSLGARSKVRVVIPQERVSYLDDGEAVFDVAQGSLTPIVVYTFLGHVIVTDARFRLAVDSFVEIEVYRGVVEVRGKEAGVIVTVREGESYLLPVDGAGAELAWLSVWPYQAPHRPLMAASQPLPSEKVANVWRSRGGSTSLIRSD